MLKEKQFYELDNLFNNGSPSTMCAARRNEGPCSTEQAARGAALFAAEMRVVADNLAASPLPFTFAACARQTSNTASSEATESATAMPVAAAPPK